MMLAGGAVPEVVSSQDGLTLVPEGKAGVGQHGPSPIKQGPVQPFCNPIL